MSSIYFSMTTCKSHDVQDLTTYETAWDMGKQISSVNTLLWPYTISHVLRSCDVVRFPNNSFQSWTQQYLVSILMKYLFLKHNLNFENKDHFFLGLSEICMCLQMMLIMTSSHPAPIEKTRRSLWIRAIGQDGVIPTAPHIWNHESRRINLRSRK